MKATRCLLLGLLLAAAVLAVAGAGTPKQPAAESSTGVVAGVRRMLRDYWGGRGYGGRHYFHNGGYGGAWNTMSWEGPGNGFANGNYWFTRMYRAPRIPNEYRMETSSDRRFARVTRKAA